MHIDDQLFPPIPSPGAHGGDAQSLARALGLAVEEVLDLSMSLNPLAPDVAPLVATAAGAARHYPDDTEATVALAEVIGVEVNQILLTNGGAEAIALVAEDLGTAQIIEPEFSLWRRHLHCVAPVTERLGDGRVRSNPNNPTGHLAGVDEVATVWDEAFYPLATGKWTRGDIDQGAIIVGSLTKLFACPGLRLGYVLSADSQFIDRLRWRQPRWSVSSVALAITPRLIAHAPLGEWADELIAWRATLTKTLRSYDLNVESADAPWVLVTGVHGLRDALARHGVLVRDCTNFGLADTVRIAVPGPAALARLTSVLESVRTEAPWA